MPFGMPCGKPACRALLQVGLVSHELPCFSGDHIFDFPGTFFRFSAALSQRLLMSAFGRSSPPEVENHSSSGHQNQDDCDCDGVSVFLDE